MTYFSTCLPQNLLSSLCSSTSSTITSASTVTMGGLAIAICPSPPKTHASPHLRTPCTTPPTIVSQAPARSDMDNLRRC
ncbi:uncharacterized protein CC84DRAFT_1162801 [Paraphaeosphaeria sporulosa]|uniref:Uncharacterized protein n=1 Tax=Paraphaeosphaeria sporulosa TaxID=1460663 RepID=A0A177CNB9_9PLEO|nr:uncharacterized protein CC84DRAFT_1162801 [Paraphaeosphaeria sporulosa]OAG09004.1 hypothetical protein CC84DRAFT_1162801 [Paraphaeosphaeria sporulosa]